MTPEIVLLVPWAIGPAPSAHEVDQGFVASV